jgi:hypothetical protein
LAETGFVNASLANASFANPSVGGCLLAVAMSLLGKLLPARSLRDGYSTPSFS